MWFVWAIQANGVGGFLKHLFGPKGETSGIVRVLMVVIFFAVGWLEVISILFRPIALSFRLFGNIYAGESILEAMSTMVPWLSPILPIPFYFLEVLVGFVQALVVHAFDSGLHNVDRGTPGGTGTRALIFGDLMTRSQNQLTKI